MNSLIVFFTVMKVGENLFALCVEYLDSSTLSPKENFSGSGRKVNQTHIAHVKNQSNSSPDQKNLFMWMDFRCNGFWMNAKSAKWNVVLEIISWPTKNSEMESYTFSKWRRESISLKIWKFWIKPAKHLKICLKTAQSNHSLHLLTQQLTSYAWQAVLGKTV